MITERSEYFRGTVTDHASRYLLLCEALESNREELALRAFDRLFRERGLPQAIRSDNGVPFASPHGLFQLSKLSVWWLRLGISIELFSELTGTSILGIAELSRQTTVSC